MTKSKTTILMGTGALALTLFASPFTGQAAETKAKLKPYPLKTCLVSGEKLGEMGAPYSINYKGQEIKFCCKGCVKDFNKDPEAYLKKMVKPYPLKTCLVSGEELTSMGKPAVINYQGQEIKFCCKDCMKKFNKDPREFLKKLKKEVAARENHASQASHDSHAGHEGHNHN